MQKEIGLLFNADMAMANMARRKRETRRMRGLDMFNENPDAWEFKGFQTIKGELHACFYQEPTQFNIGGTYTRKCPYGNVGDLLWQRETWFSTSFYYKELLKGGVTSHMRYKADGDYDPIKDCFGRNWKPSIHMPKEAARCWMETTEIGIERLQDITDAGAIAEGIKTIGVEEMPSPYNDMAGGYHCEYVDYTKRGEFAGWGGDAGCCRTARQSYQTLFESINGEGSWSLNPWVWVIKYKILSTTGKPQNT